jgi:hypothetical protein
VTPVDLADIREHIGDLALTLPLDAGLGTSLL